MKPILLLFLPVKQLFKLSLTRFGLYGTQCGLKLIRFAVKLPDEGVNSSGKQELCLARGSIEPRKAF